MMRQTTEFPPSARPVRVLHVVPQLRLGGMERGVVKLVNGLAERQIASSICTFDARLDRLKDAIDPRVPVHALGRRHGNDPRLVWRLVQLLRRDRPDIVHTHAWGALCEGYAAARLARVPRFVHGEHGTMELRRRNRLVQRLIWNRADRVLSVSANLAARMAREVGVARRRIHVITNGADLARFGAVPRAAARRALQLGDREFVVGTVGRLVPVKDHGTLVALLVELRRLGLECRALVVGDGPLRAELEQRARAAGLGSSLRVLGDRGDVEQVLAALDVFVLTSVSEGLPNSVLEAMASRLPVVATQVGGVDELVEHGRTGLLAGARDAAALAAAVSTLARDGGLRQQMGAAGRRKATTEFGLDRMLEQYARVYLELAGQDAWRPGPRSEETSPRCAASLAG